MMSFTSTVPSTNANKITRTSSVLLSPSKRRRIEPSNAASPIQPASDSHTSTSPSNANSTRIDHTRNTTLPRDNPVSSAPSTAEIWKWTLTKDAVAPCFVKDALEMRECTEAEFFWLGRIPCRSVHLVGLLVGVQVFEQRTIYSLDDGSAVIDCIQRHPAMPTIPPLRSKLHSLPKPRSSSMSISTSSSPYKRPAPSAPKTTLNALPAASFPLPKPVAQVGASVRVVGRIVKRGQRRVLLVDEIGTCSSPNEEPKHWLNVLNLHSTSYFALHLGPFVIPKPKLRSSSTYANVSRVRESGSPEKGKDRKSDEFKVIPEGKVAETRGREPQTPSSDISSISGSPSSVTSFRSKDNDKQSPPRLRHPSRLHTRDLTANTFRIYLKHYMDHAPSPQSHSRSTSPSSSRSVSPCPPPRNSQSSRPLQPLSIDNSPILKTPTKRSSLMQERGALSTTRMSAEQTPRASRVRSRPDHGGTDCTPRPSGKTQPYGRSSHAAIGSDKNEETSGVIYGYTLSHFRRVPELATLARRVVDAEARRRAREERKRAETGTIQDKGKQSQKAKDISREPRGAKMKRLFRFAIRQLYEEGSIVLWDGPVRALPSSVSFSQGSDALWKANASSNTAISTYSSISLGDVDDEAALSDPPSGEETYIPLTPAYFSKPVEQAITNIMARTASAASASKYRARSRLDCDPSAPLQPPAPPPGPTPAEILAWLHRDMRWERVGEWAVKDALEWAKSQGRVWCVGRGRWELCE